VCTYDEEKNKFVQRSVAASQARDAKAMEAQKKEAARAKKARFDRITTMLDLSQAEYREMRKNNFFAMTKNTKERLSPQGARAHFQGDLCQIDQRQSVPPEDH
jgi:hypothetical protein